jgi:hypothetical protein
MEFETFLTPGANVLLNAARAALLMSVGWVAAQLLS